MVSTLTTFLSYKTNRFDVAVGLLSNRSKSGKNISDTLSFASRISFLFLSQFEVICDKMSSIFGSICNQLVLTIKRTHAVVISDVS